MPRWTTPCPGPAAPGARTRPGWEARSTMRRQRSRSRAARGPALPQHLGRANHCHRRDDDHREPRFRHADASEGRPECSVQLAVYSRRRRLLRIRSRRCHCPHVSGRGRRQFRNGSAVPADRLSVCGGQFSADVAVSDRAANPRLEPEQTTGKWLAAALGRCELVGRARDEERRQIGSTECAHGRLADRERNLA